MIITSKSRISFTWIVLAALPWVAMIFKDKVMGIAFTLSMRKFVENPAALTFLLTVPAYISWVIPPVVNFLADRIWTRIGRRKPFIICSWIGTITSITLMPLAPDFGWLLAAYIAFSIFNDMGGPVESLKMEIVPPAQRGTSQAVLSWIAQVAVLVFWVVAIGRYNEMSLMFGVPVSGEQGLFWCVTVGMIVMLLFLTLGIKETNPHSSLLGQKFSFRNIFGGLLSKHLWPVYILIFSVGILGTGLGAFNVLLTTEQWGYTNQDLGTNIAVGGIINLFLIPILGLLANKVGRGHVYVGLVIAGITVTFSMFLYYNFVLFDARPTLIEMIVFGEMASVIGILTGMSLTPFQYDFIPRNELGTFAAGSSVVGRVTGIITTTLMGLFVWGYATLFLGPPGEMARVTLRDDTPQAQVQKLLNRVPWTNPDDGAPLPAPKLTAQAWYATGAKLDHGRGFEIRLADEDSRILRDQRDRLEDERGRYRTRRGYASTRWQSLTKQKLPTPANTQPATASTQTATTNAVQPAIADIPQYVNTLLDEAAATTKALRAARPTNDPATKLLVDIEAERAGEDTLAAGVKRLEAILEARAADFSQQVQNHLGASLLRDGDQVLGTETTPALIATFPLRSRPEGNTIEATLDKLHKADAAIVDLRVVTKDKGFELTISARAISAEAAGMPERLIKALTKSAPADLQAVMNWPPANPTVVTAQAVQLDLRIIEDPLDRHPSPISRVVNNIGSMFAEQPTPERRLYALGRNIRRADFIEHAQAQLVPGDDNAVRLVAIVTPNAVDNKIELPPEAVTKRLTELVGAKDAVVAGKLYALAVPAAKEQRMTVARPVLLAAYAKQQYDYLAGYIAVFVMQLIGLGITFFFLYMVRTGRIRRRGAEEAEAIK
ncbi:MAG: MFS transporter [Phycisphaerae bacterium]